jgi:hypothetical protein
MATNDNKGRAWSRLALSGALLAAAALAQAQYAWIDDKGLKQYSDRPPPPSVPANRILKGLGAGLGAAPVQATDIAPPVDGSPAAPAKAAPAKAAPTIAERNAEFRKRKDEEAEKARKAEEDERRKSANDSHCDANRKHKLMLESGARISTVEKSGERGYLSDEQRARQLQDAQRALANCK